MAPAMIDSSLLVTRAIQSTMTRWPICKAVVDHPWLRPGPRWGSSQRSPIPPSWWGGGCKTCTRKTLAQELCKNYAAVKILAQFLCKNFSLVQVFVGSCYFISFCKWMNRLTRSRDVLGVNCTVPESYLDDVEQSMEKRKIRPPAIPKRVNRWSPNLRR